MEGDTVQLATLLSYRTQPAAGLHMALTRRCPLSCAHCSTNSMLSSEEHGGDMFLRFVETFTADDRPHALLLTGGEPLLRPQLVIGLAERAHAVGSRIHLMSGMFFARRPKVPVPIQRAIAAVDHLTASLDIFHEQQVSRADVFRVIRELVDEGKTVSFQITGLNADDPYLEEVTEDIRRTFHDQVPAMVRYVDPVGRAKTWLTKSQEPVASEIVPMPCTGAAWPVVAFDGTVVACCNQAVVDGPVPPHLRLGHIVEDDWQTVRARSLESPMIRAIRAFGPEYMADRFSAGKIACTGYCATCYKLGSEPGLFQRIEELTQRPVMRLIEAEMATLRREEFEGQFFAREYAPMLRLGGAASGGLS
jgi:pyruvate-formate lyase-activating enzyme